MNEISVDILLEFLYNKFAVTFLMCLIGACIRESLASSKKSDTLNIKKIVASTVFSTFLMCACADYLDIPFSVYAIVSIFCGMWGLALVKLAMNGKFVHSLLVNIAKKFADPIVKSAIDSASNLDKKETDNNKEDTDKT